MIYLVEQQQGTFSQFCDHRAGEIDRCGSFQATLRFAREAEAMVVQIVLDGRFSEATKDALPVFDDEGDEERQARKLGQWWRELTLWIKDLSDTEHNVFSTAQVTWE